MQRKTITKSQYDQSEPCFSMQRQVVMELEFPYIYSLRVLHFNFSEYLKLQCHQMSNTSYLAHLLIFENNSKCTECYIYYPISNCHIFSCASLVGNLSLLARLFSHQAYFPFSKQIVSTGKNINDLLH